jgi:uncharacterized membrane protein YvbJ
VYVKEQSQCNWNSTQIKQKASEGQVVQSEAYDENETGICEDFLSTLVEICLLFPSPSSSFYRA